MGETQDVASLQRCATMPTLKHVGAQQLEWRSSRNGDVAAAPLLRCPTAMSYAALCESAVSLERRGSALSVIVETQDVASLQAMACPTMLRRFAVFRDDAANLPGRCATEFCVSKDAMIF